jgi:hypothetical protein
MNRVDLVCAVQSMAMRAFPLGHEHQPVALERINALAATAWDDTQDYPQSALWGAWEFVCRRTTENPAEIVEVIGA